MRRLVAAGSAVVVLLAGCSGSDREADDSLGSCPASADVFGAGPAEFLRPESVLVEASGVRVGPLVDGVGPLLLEAPRPLGPRPLPDLSSVRIHEAQVQQLPAPAPGTSFVLAVQGDRVRLLGAVGSDGRVRFTSCGQRAVLGSLDRYADATGSAAESVLRAVTADPDGAAARSFLAFFAPTPKPVSAPTTTRPTADR